MTIGQTISQYRETKGWTRQQLAEQTSTSIDNIIDLEEDSSVPVDTELINKICSALEVPPSAVLFNIMTEGDFNSAEKKELYRLAKPIMDSLISSLLKD